MHAVRARGLPIWRGLTTETKTKLVRERNKEQERRHKGMAADHARIAMIEEEETKVAKKRENENHLEAFA